MPDFFSACTGQYKKSQEIFVIDGILTNAAVILTSGMFLSGYLVFLNAPDFLVGLLNNTPSWALVVSLFSFLIYERMQKRKKFLITLNVIARFLICSIVFLPLIFKDHNIVLALTACMIIIGNILWGIYGTGVTVWMISLVDAKKRTNYIYMRMFYLRISFTITTILMGLLLDWFNKNYTGFLIVYMISLVISLLDAYILYHAEEPVNEIANGKKINFNEFLVPLKDKRYRHFLISVLLFYLSITMANSFNSLYQIRYLKLNYGFISSVNVVAYIMMILFTKYWGRMETKKGISYVMRITGFFIFTDLFVWSFVTDNTYYLLYLAAIFSGIGNSGFNISIVTYRYDIIPEGNKTIYEGWFGAVVGISTMFGPILGNKLIKTLPIIHNSIYQYSNFQFLYLISFTVGIVIVFAMFKDGRKTLQN